jgi:hypothetical protein
MLIHGFNDIGFLRASIMCMEKSQMKDTEAASSALEKLERVEFCGTLLKYNKNTITAEQSTLMLNNCETLRSVIKDCINTQKRG